MILFKMNILESKFQIMKKPVMILFVSIIGFLAVARAYASWDEGNEFTAIRSTDGLMAGGGMECRIGKGDITNVLVPLGRYNLLVVMNANKCISLVSQT